MYSDSQNTYTKLCIYIYTRYYVFLYTGVRIYVHTMMIGLYPKI